MRSAHAPAALFLAAALAGCGGEDAAPAPVSAEPEVAGSSSATLRAVVGTPEDPDAFEITLQDASGEAVERLRAGRYTIEVQDLSRIHNFRLIGAGVDVATSVRDVENTTFDVTLEEGGYSFLCDPHPNMRGDLEVS